MLISLPNTTLQKYHRPYGYAQFPRLVLGKLIAHYTVQLIIHPLLKVLDKTICLVFILRAG